MPRSTRSDLDAIWSEVRSALGASLPRPMVDLWFERVRPLDLRAGTLTLSVPPADRAWIERRYRSLLDRLARRASGEVERIVIADAPLAPSPTAPTPLVPNPLHTFGRFVIGSGNRLAHTAALAVAELPGEAYNPLFIHGPPGLGKTHLLGAIAAYLEERRPELTVHYTTAERFTTEFVACLREAGPSAFKRRYRGLDALLIDDVQALEGKRRTEEEFVDTFNALHGAGKQIVLSSDRPPEALEQLAERLRDRFNWGLTVDIQPPDLRTRLALLWRMASSLPLDLPDPTALAAIASSATGNVRRLEGAMTRVAASASMLGTPINRTLVASALGAGTPPAGEGRPPLDLEAVKAAVATSTGVSLADLDSTSRSRRATHARQLAMYLASELAGAPVMSIARAFQRDHATVAHALKAVASRLEPGSPTLVALHGARRELGVPEQSTGPFLHPPDDHPPLQPTGPSPALIEDRASTPHPSTTPIHLP